MECYVKELNTYIKEASTNTKKFAKVLKMFLYEKAFYTLDEFYIYHCKSWCEQQIIKIKIILYCYDNCKILPGCINDTAHCINVLIILYFMYHYNCNVVFVIKDIDYFHIQGYCIP